MDIFVIAFLILILIGAGISIDSKSYIDLDTTTL